MASPRPREKNANGFIELHGEKKIHYCFPDNIIRAFFFLPIDEENWQHFREEMPFSSIFGKYDIIGVLFTYNYCTVCLVKIWFVYYLSFPTQKEALVRKMNPFSFFLTAFSAFYSFLSVMFHIVEEFGNVSTKAIWILQFTYALSPIANNIVQVNNLLLKGGRIQKSLPNVESIEVSWRSLHASLEGCYHH